MAEDEDDDESGVEKDPTHCLRWDEIIKAQANQKLQRRGQKEFPMRNRQDAEGCPQCGRPAESLEWIYYTNAPKYWMSECGREGWVVACMDCRRQADFILTIMS